MEPTPSPSGASPSPPAPLAPPTAREVFASGSVRALLGASFLSTAGVTCMTTALGKVMYDLTARELDLGLLGLVEFLPALLLVAVSGHVADRFDRRRVAAFALSFEVAASIVLALYIGSSPSAVWPMFLTVFAFGIARAFAAPATRALPPNVVDERLFPRLAALSSVAWQSATILGPVLGGFLLAADPTWPFYAAAFMLAVSGVLILVIRLHASALAAAAERERAAQRPTLRNAAEGLRVVRRDPILLGAISLDLFAVLFGGAIALLPALAKDDLGVGAVGLGWLRAAGGIGASIMGVALAARPVRRHVGRALLVAVGVFGLATVLLGVTSSYVVAFAAILVLSAADSVSVFVRATLVPLVTPDDSRGRVLAVENVFIGASNELGAFESGVAGQLLGPAGAIALGGAASVAIAAIWWLAFPALRGVDRFADLTPST